eukprot:301526-Amphidinium_carterae.1
MLCKGGPSTATKDTVKANPTTCLRHLTTSSQVHDNNDNNDDNDNDNNDDNDNDDNSGTRHQIHNIPKL